MTLLVTNSIPRGPDGREDLEKVLALGADPAEEAQSFLVSETIGKARAASDIYKDLAQGSHSIGFRLAPPIGSLPIPAWFAVGSHSRGTKSLAQVDSAPVASLPTKLRPLTSVKRRATAAVAAVGCYVVYRGIRNLLGQ